MIICHVEKFLLMVDFFTGTACGACNNYQVGVVIIKLYFRKCYEERCKNQIYSGDKCFETAYSNPPDLLMFVSQLYALKRSFIEEKLDLTEKYSLLTSY